MQFYVCVKKVMRVGLQQQQREYRSFLDSTQIISFLSLFFAMVFVKVVSNPVLHFTTIPNKSN